MNMVNNTDPDTSIIVVHDNKLPSVVTVIESNGGYGLATTRDFACGETIYENDILKINDSNQVYMKHIRNDGTYELIDNTTYTINRNTYREFFYFDSFTNHSCDPNAEHVYITDTRYKIVARRDIRCGEELTNDYTTFDTDNDADLFECGCNSSNCKRFI